jgi:hypothetical protein
MATPLQPKKHPSGTLRTAYIEAMLTTNDIYATAERLIKEHGRKAEEMAQRRMHELMAQDDAKGAAEWLSIMAAIEDLHSLKNQKKLH